MMKSLSLELIGHANYLGYVGNLSLPTYLLPPLLQKMVFFTSSIMTKMTINSSPLV
jgi:hypothetical protein